MASCDHDGIDETEEEVEVPTYGNKGKRKDAQRDSSPKVKRKLQSWVWDHFTKQKENIDKANCHYCGKVMTCPTKSGTSSMKKHLLSCKSFKAWESANKFKDQTVLGTDGDGELRLCKVSESVVREATNEMLVIAELPLAFVESLAWRHFCFRVHLYKPVSRRTSTRDIVQMYVNKKAEMKKILGQYKQRLSLTTDIWVAPSTCASYMVITAHFIDASWQLKKLILSFKNICDHKGATISKVLVDCLAEWDIKRVFSITVDNATANSSAMRRFKTEFNKLGDDALVLKGKFMHLRCATHILNLVVKDCLQEIDSSVNVIRNGIHFVRSSTPRLYSFEHRVESERVQRGSLPLDVKTRWNSTYLMLEQAIKFRIGFDKMEAEDIPYNDYFKVIVDGKKKNWTTY